jgi:alpha-tubulin suppressor-like RCC1 family protein
MSAFDRFPRSIAIQACAAALLGAPAALAAPNPHLTVVPGLEAVIDLSVGADHACALTREGTVACWGSGRHFQLGDLVTTGRATPRVIPDLRGVRNIEAGATTTCAQLDTGEVACWGAYDNGMTDPSVDILEGVKAPTTVVPSVAWARAFAVGGQRAAFVGQDGSLALWEVPASTPVPIADFSDILEVTVGYNHLCARKADGTVQCLGPNYGGECGNGGDGEAINPVDVVGASELDEALYPHTFRSCGNSPAKAACATKLRGVVDLDAFGRLTCAVLESGRVACWGVGADAQAKWLGSMDFARIPILVPGLTDAVSVAVGWSHVCALRKNGRVACWGDDTHGELGDGVHANMPNSDETLAYTRRPPRDVKGLEDVVQLEAGVHATCARLTTGRVVCWGEPLGKTAP